MSNNRVSGAQPVCGGCRLWHRGPPDPNNLGAPRLGQCRERVHMLALSGGGQVNIQGIYIALPEDFPACSHHQGRVELGLPGG